MISGGHTTSPSLGFPHEDDDFRPGLIGGPDEIVEMKYVVSGNVANMIMPALCAFSEAS